MNQTNAHDVVILQTIARRVLRGQKDAVTRKMVESLSGEIGEIALHLVGEGDPRHKVHAQIAQQTLEEVRAYQEHWRALGEKLAKYEAELMAKVSASSAKEPQLAGAEKA